MTSLRVRTGVFLFLVALLAPGPMAALASTDDELLGCDALEALGLALPGFCNGNGNGAGNNGKGDGSNGNDPTTTTTTTTVAVTTTSTTSTTPITATTSTTSTTSTTVPDTTTTTRPSPATTRPPVTTSTSSTTPATTSTTLAGGGTTPPATGGSPPVPVATTTTTVATGLGAVDMSTMDPTLVGAVMMVHAKDQEQAGPAPGPATMAGRLERLLGPVAPPALVDAVASPLVIFEALVDALTSSGQALIVPSLAFLVGLGIPGSRRKTLLGEVLDPDLALTERPLRSPTA